MYKNKILLLLVLLLLVACSPSRNFSTKKESLDPMTMYSYSNLALPPVYYLSSKEIIDKRKYMLSRQRDISLSLTSAMGGRENIQTSNDFTSSDIQFLTKMDANRDLSFIRETLNQETLFIVRKNNSFISKVFSNSKGEALENVFFEYRVTNKR